MENKGKRLNLKEASELTGLAESTIYVKSHKRSIPCINLGKKLIFFENELIAWMETFRKKTKSEIEAEAERKFIEANPT